MSAVASMLFCKLDKKSWLVFRLNCKIGMHRQNRRICYLFCDWNLPKCCCLDAELEPKYRPVYLEQVEIAARLEEGLGCF